MESQFKAGDTRAAYAHDHASALEKRVPHLTIRLQAGAPASARVFRDDEELGAASLGVALPVEPGPHTIIVRVGRAESRFPVNAVEGKNVELAAAAPADAARDAAPETASAAPVDKTRPRPDGARSQPAKPTPDRLAAPSADGNPRTLGWVLVGAGGVGIAVGGVAGVIALSDARSVKSACGPDYATCDSASVDAASTGKTMATVSTIAFVAGGVVAAAGLYLVLTSPSRAWTAASAPVAAVGVGPGGAALRGSF